MAGYTIEILVLAVIALIALGLAFGESIRAEEWKYRALVAERRLEAVMSRGRMSGRVRVVRVYGVPGVPEVFIRAFAEDDGGEDE